MSSVIALILARSGSKGVPNKNIRKLAGHTLLEWSISACLKSKIIQKVFVSTDSTEYARIAELAGAEAPFLRPPEISTDYSTDFEAIDHALNWISYNLFEPELIAHIRPTTPLRDPALIDQAILKFMSSNKATSLRSVHEMSESAYKTLEITENGQLKLIGSNSTSLDEGNSARQLFTKTYTPNGYVDVLSSRFIKDAKLMHGDFVLPFITPVVSEVDTEIDFKRLEFEVMNKPELLSIIFSEE